MKRYIASLLTLIVVTSSYASQVTVSARIDSTSMLIGQQTRLHLQTVKEAGDNVAFPLLKDTITEGLEVVALLKPDTQRLSSGQLQITEDVIVTGFDSALVLIPPFTFFVNGDSMQTEPLSIKINTVEVDTLKNDIKDIRPVYSMPIQWGRIILYVLLALALIAGGYFAYRYWKNRRKGAVVKDEEEVPVDPYTYAIDNLNRIKSEKVWQQGKVKEFYTDVTDVLRQYLQYRYRIDAMEMTSEQIVEAFSRSSEGKDGESTVLIRKILELSDLVKFAKWTPTFNEHEIALSEAYDFVEHTKQILQEVEEAGEKAGARGNEERRNA
ncbi:MAG: DUF4381 domain-containing protein [Paludibacteraceae bacterium]|nr:DUF4381 domain-containing protein [Paludibacteraceae bacterium]